uniref:4-aminobutyrate aminotransferase n=1 Tax=Macrostomum lignano TaxID=282301 RepID=A0A1I8F8Q2_9PLAT
GAAAQARPDPCPALSQSQSRPGPASAQTACPPPPRSKQLMEEAQSKKAAASRIIFLLTTAKSSGNYIVDRNVHQPDRPWDVCPPSDWVDRLNASLLSVAPKGLSRVQTMMCGSCANENAHQDALHAVTWPSSGAGRPVSQQELDSTMLNELPGTRASPSSQLHGRTLGVLSCTRSKAIHKLDVPAFQWPAVDFPAYKYPLEQHQEHNAKQGEAQPGAGGRDGEPTARATEPVAGLIVEPILAEGGDIHARPEYFKALRSLCSKLDVPLLVDEVQTGGGLCGTYWAHEQWGLDSPPDAVTGRCLGGIYFSDNLVPDQQYRVYNTWLGEPSKVMLLEAVIRTIKREKLMDSVLEAGTRADQGARLVLAVMDFLILKTNFIVYLISAYYSLRAEGLSQRYPQLINSPAGWGIMCAVDFADTNPPQ